MASGEPRLTPVARASAQCVAPLHGAHPTPVTLVHACFPPRVCATPQGESSEATLTVHNVCPFPLTFGTAVRHGVAGDPNLPMKPPFYCRCAGPWPRSGRAKATPNRNESMRNDEKRRDTMRNGPASGPHILCPCFFSERGRWGTLEKGGSHEHTYSKHPRFGTRAMRYSPLL